MGAESGSWRRRRRSSRTSRPASGVDLGGWSWGAQFGDLNNDGTLDLYLVNGYVSAGERSSYWYDFSRNRRRAQPRSSATRANWPAMRGRSLSGYQRKRVWLNDGAGPLHRRRAGGRRRDTYDGRAVALADLSNRGALDVLVANQRGPLLALPECASTADRHWIQFELEGTPSNRSAHRRARRGAVERRRQVQEVTAAAASARRTTGGCTTASAARTRGRSRAHPLAVRPAQTIEQPHLDTLHRIKEAHAS